MELILSAAAATIASLVATCFYIRRSATHAWQIPDTLPWVGRRDEVFSKIRACIRELSSGDRTRTEGYAKYSRKGQPFVIPDPGLKPQVMLPPEQVQWMLEQPDAVLGRRADNEKLGFLYMTNLMSKPDPVISETIRKDLTRNLLRQHADLSEEIRQSVDATMGGVGPGPGGDSWVEVNLLQTMETIVVRASSRALVGLPLCRSQEYLSAMSAMILAFARGSLALRLVPWFVRPALGFFMGLSYNFYKARALKIVLPLITESMSNIKRQAREPSFTYDSSDDFVKWMVTAALNAKSTAIHSPEDATERFLMVILALDSTVVALTNTFLDLLSSKPELGYCEALREEAATAFTSDRDWDDWAILPKLRLTDSALRETLRRNPQAVRSRQREVVNRDGLDLPDGHHLPRGAWIGFSPTDIHFDERFYEDPETYDPFRFAATVAAVASPSGGGFTESVKEGSGIVPAPAPSLDPTSSTGNKLSTTNNTSSSSMVTTSKTFLSFGHGRHACPGRFFAAHILKLIVAYITLNYDIQPLETRPRNPVYGDKSVPPQNIIIKVRRRRPVK